MNAVAINSTKTCCKTNNTLLFKSKVKKQLLFFLTFLFLGPFLTFGQTFSGTTGNIDDNNCPTTNDFTASVSGVGVLGTTKFFNEVVINITHSFDGDLEMTLIAPGGSPSVVLSSNNGGGGDNFTDTHFRSDATSSITSGSAPFTGNYRPEGDLTAFDAINADGVWTLSVCDDASQDIGSLDSWEITFGTEAVEPFDCTNPINPSPSCNALNVIVVLDESGSIDSSTESQVEAASLALANALKDTGAELAFVEFASSADIPTYGGFTGWNTVNQAYIDGLNNATTGLVAQYGSNANTTDQFTNWEDALLKVLDLNAIMTADIVLFMTDGNPNRSVDGSGNPTSSGDHVQDAADQACLIKQQGSHIFSLGVGSDINVTNLISVTGPIQDDGPGNPTLTVLSADYGLISAGDLTQCFLDIAQSGCNNDLALEKTVYAGHNNGAGCDGAKIIPNPNDSKVTYCFTITNDGDQTINNMDFSDADIGINENDLTPAFQTSMTSGQSITYYYETTFSGGQSFPFLNTAEVTGETPTGDPLSDSSSAEVTEPLCNPPGLTTENGAVCAENQTSIDLSTLVSSGGTVSYHSSQIDADNNDNALTDTNVSPLVETTYYVRSEVAADCFVTDTITISINPLPNAEADGGELNCLILTVQLTGSSSTAGVTYSWSGPNSFSSNDQNPVASDEGIYTLTVTETQTGCTATATASVTSDTTAPTANAGANTELTCTTLEVTLDGSGSSTNPDADLSYLWSGPNGFSAATEDITVSEAGTYTLTVTDNDNGCSAMSSADVTEDSEKPSADAGANAELTCTTLEVVLDGSGSSTNPDADLSYLWSGPNGYSAATEDITVSEAGTYTLTVTDNDNGCSAMSEAEVNLDTTTPTADAGANAELTCTTLEVTLDGSGSSTNPDADLSYSWSGPNGYSAATEDITVSEAGTYTLTVTDNDNGCSAMSEAEVSLDTTIPTADAGANAELTCTTLEVTLDGSGSSTNPDADLSYSWSGPNGFSAATEDITVSEAGTYTLTVTDNDNGCSAMSSADV
ncbi:proprotein convertase P-domain-containing protein, partial [Psychroserpens mesophilus]|uniref:proprotein convertase P-domain-containing protein n=1 Tax=Psychroserpens mesophilus TaxID=325473 RepID=UPI00058DEAEB